MICSIILFIVGNQYFPLIICLVLVVTRCPRWCAALITYLCRLLAGDNDPIHSEEKAIHCIQLILHTVERCNVGILFMMFPVPCKYPDGQFLKLGNFSSFILDLIYNDSMLGFQDIFYYSLHSILLFSLTMGALIGSRMGLHHPFQAHRLARSRHLAFPWPIFQSSVGVAWLPCYTVGAEACGL